MGKLVQPAAAPGGELVLWVLPPKHMRFSGRGLSLGPLLPPGIRTLHRPCIPGSRADLCPSLSSAVSAVQSAFCSPGLCSSTIHCSSLPPTPSPVEGSPPAPWHPQRAQTQQHGAGRALRNTGSRPAGEPVVAAGLLRLTMCPRLLLLMTAE